MQMNKIILFLNIPVIGGGSRYLIILASSILPMKLCLRKSELSLGALQRKKKQHPREF